MTIRFSDYFSLGKSQAELDFVDVPLTTDLPLYVDPYALSLEEAEWFVRCNDLVVDFFELVVNSIRLGDERRAKRLLSHLREPNDTRLGLSSGRPRGSGIGGMQSEQLFERLRDSQAVRTGMLRDLADAELVIPGIGRDKISDMTTNIIRGELLKYTKSQCDLHEIPTRTVAAGLYWDSERGGWRNTYASLPVYESSRIVLVPKAAVRHELSVDHQRYYRQFVLEFLQTEHYNAGDSLVTVLKNGRRTVYKKDLEKEYPLSKDFLFKFSEDHPEVLERYKKSLSRQPMTMSDEQIEALQPDPRDIHFDEMIERLQHIPTGNDSASDYHNFILGALSAVFSPALAHPVKEQEINEGRKRIDIAFTNRDRNGFFYFLSNVHHIHCPYIFFECKNYGKDVTNPEIDQLAGRFSDSRGRMGFLVCRSISDHAVLLRRCRDLVHDKREYIVVLTDSEVIELLRLRARDDHYGITTYLDQRFAELVM